MSLCFMLTAGQGTRLKPYTDYYAKPTLPLLNIPLAYYGFYLAAQGGFKDYLMNKHHLPNQIEILASSLKDHCREITTVDETEKLLGSGGALWNARDILRKHEFFMIANGDEVLIPTDSKVINKLVRFFNEKKTLSCLLTCDHPELMKSLKPVWVTPDQTVIGFGMDAPPGEPRPVHYTGYKVFSSKILDWLPNGESNIFYEVLVEAISQGQNIFHYHLDQAEWHETGNPRSFFEASRTLAQTQWAAINQRRQFFGWKPLWKTVDNSKQLIGEDENLKQHWDQISGHVVVGSGVHWPENQFVKDAIVFSNQSIADSENPKSGIFLEESE